MDIRKLGVFVTVAEERSFTRAAERLRIAQSGVSTAVRALERELGTPLFDRTTQRVELTDAGHALLPEATRILAAVEAAREVVTQVGQGLRGRLRLGILYGLTPGQVREALAAFRAEFPLVELWLTAPGSAGSLDHLERLREGSLDLAIVITHGPVPGIRRQVLTTDEVVLACTPDHALADRDGIDLAELAEEPFIEFPPGWGVRSAVDQAFASAGVQRRITVQMNDLSTILDLVRLGLGVAFVPRPIRDQNADLRFLRVRRTPPTYQIAIAAAADRPLGPVARQFLRVTRADSGERTTG
ncbi:LysR family transcriptional regulator [Micromonospora sp. NPDC050417]|uniref:LysR family transcriptional regulator n=1 Tax=Micromonospora sp. NPDC050417 TaxID=3364280 RepID=UPI00378CBE7D